MFAMFADSGPKCGECQVSILYGGNTDPDECNADMEIFSINDMGSFILCCRCNKTKGRLDSAKFASIGCTRCKQLMATPGIESGTGHIGLVMSYIRHKGFGFILDKDTRTKIWFHHSKLRTAADASQCFGVGQRCLFDKQIKWSGKKPGSTHAISIRTIDGAPFKILDEWNW